MFAHQIILLNILIIDGVLYFLVVQMGQVVVVSFVLNFLHMSESHFEEDFYLIFLSH